MNLHKLTKGDLLVAGAIVMFAIFAIALHSSIAGLADMGAGIRKTGEEVRTTGRQTADEITRSLEPVASAAGGLPIVGGNLAANVRDTARRSSTAVERATRLNGNQLVQVGLQGERDARDTARLVGWMSFLVPTILLLAQWLPRRLPELRGQYE